LEQEGDVTTETHVTTWQLQGDSAGAYEKLMVPAIFREGAEQIVAHAAIRSGERVVDVGCGTGIVARVAAEQVGANGSVVGVDINEQMLDVARAASEASSLSIDWRQGPAEDLPLPRSSFDAVLSQQAFQFFEDRSRALAEMRRVLAPGGRLVFSVLRSIEHNRTYRPVVEAFARHGGEDLGLMMQSPFPDLTAEDLRGLAQEAGFGGVTVSLKVIQARFPSIPEFLHSELSSSPLGDVVASKGGELFDAIVRDVSRDLHHQLDDFGIMHPLQTYVVSARN
jgi:ubiquinone/menaquinone biosynthesis C-methylase UbiE